MTKVRSGRNVRSVAIKSGANLIPQPLSHAMYKLSLVGDAGPPLQAITVAKSSRMPFLLA